jgi:hypothetical protein
MIPKDRLLTLWTHVCVFHLGIGLTWALTICETALIALVPLFIGFAINGLLAEQTSALFQLAGVMAALIVVSVIRRIYDTRVFGTVRLEVGRTQATRASTQPVSKSNARLGMGRELVDFLEIELPMVTTAIIQIIICHHRHVLCLSCKPMEIPACVSVQASCEDSDRPYSQTVHYDQAHYDPTATNAHQKLNDGHWINPRRLMGKHKTSPL